VSPGPFAVRGQQPPFDLEMNHIACSVGRDLRLAPPQQGECILFFAGSYAEVDGKAYAAISRHITFAQAS
jgi:hypothetical protein